MAGFSRSCPAQTFQVRSIFCTFVVLAIINIRDHHKYGKQSRPISEVIMGGGGGVVPKVLPKAPDESGPSLEGEWRPQRRQSRLRESCPAASYGPGGEESTSTVPGQ